MLNKLLEGVQRVTAGQFLTARGGQQGDAIVSELHGRYYESTVRQKRFIGAMQAVLATATIAGVSTTMTGALTLANPVASPVNLVMDKVGVGFVLAPAAPLAFGLAGGVSGTAIAGTLTEVAIRNAFLGGVASQAKLYSSATLTLPVAPTVLQVLGALEQGAVTVSNNNPSMFDLEGSIVIPPGGFVTFWTSAVLAASAHIASYEWEEVPILL